VSHDAHFATDPTDHQEETFPPGRIGITGGVLLFVLAAGLCSLMQGLFVSLASSPWAHVWPSISSTKIDLPPANLGS
jgi:hypothetical protein